MLNFFCTAQFWGEAAKLVAQLGGALLIAWLAVRWALSRYKAEKLWDREATALFDVLGAIADLESVNTSWIRDEVRQIETSADQDEKLRQRYSGAKSRLESIAATATVLLPTEMTKAIDDLLKALNTRYGDWQEDLSQTDAAVGKARTELVRLGRLRLKGTAK